MKILYGELVIIEYVNGQFVNRWGVVTDKNGIEAGEGRTIQDGKIDIMIEGKAGSKIADNRYNIPAGSQVAYLTDSGFGSQPFSGKTLTILKTLNTTDIFNSSGVKIGTLPGGTPIGIETGSAGNSNRHLMSVNAFQDTDGSWKFINQSTYSYGFINVQLGFGTKMYNSTRAIETAPSHVKNADLDWSLIGSSLAYASAESFLRNYPANASLAEMQTNVDDYFAGLDLNADDVVLGDPTLFILDEKHLSFLKKNLIASGNTAQADKLQDENTYLEVL